MIWPPEFRKQPTKGILQESEIDGVLKDECEEPGEGEGRTISTERRQSKGLEGCSGLLRGQLQIVGVCWKAERVARGKRDWGGTRSHTVEGPGGHLSSLVLLLEETGPMRGF